MADFATTDLVQPAVSESSPGGYTTDLLWWFEAPPSPPAASDPVKALQVAQVFTGRSRFAQLLGGLISTGSAYSFKLGEGGWKASAEISTVVGQGIGVASFSGTVDGPPIVPETLTLDAGGTRQVTDVPNSPWDGTGVLVDSGQVQRGTVNYKENDVTVTYAAIIPGGQNVTAICRHRGSISPAYQEDIAPGASTTGPYAGTLTAHPVHRNSVVVTDTNDISPQILVDDGNGNLTGDGTGTVNYETGAISVTFTSIVSPGWYARAHYKAEGVPMPPSKGRTSLYSESDDGLFTFTKALSSGDRVFQGAGTRTTRISIEVLASEGNDDGHGYSPFYTEGGLFDEDDNLLLYFTMPGTRKTAAGTIQHDVDLVI